MELKCQLVIRMACNSGFAFIDGKGTLTKIAASSSSAGLCLTSSGSKRLDLCSTPTPVCHSGLSILISSPRGQEEEEGPQEQGWDQRAANHTGYKNGKIRFRLKDSLVVFLVTEIPKVVLKGFRSYDISWEY